MKTMRWIKAVSGGMALCLLLCLCGFYGECRGVRDSVVRLHILANSDSEEDQTLKLQVRDAVTATAAGWLDGVTEQTEALRVAQQRLPELEQVAQQTVYAAGYKYPVVAQTCRMYFTTREYGSVTLPAGVYDAVRFTIGAGAGHNWWCVVYPPLCLGSAVENPDALSGVLTGSQEDLVTGGERYTVRFKIVEWAEQLLQWVRTTF